MDTTPEDTSKKTPYWYALNTRGGALKPCGCGSEGIKLKDGSPVCAECERVELKVASWSDHHSRAKREGRFRKFGEGYGEKKQQEQAV